MDLKYWNLALSNLSKNCNLSGLSGRYRLDRWSESKGEEGKIWVKDAIVDLGYDGNLRNVMSNSPMKNGMTALNWINFQLLCT